MTVPALGACMSECFLRRPDRLPHVHSPRPPEETRTDQTRAQCGVDLAVQPIHVLKNWDREAVQ